jgi:hypothetical protein
MEKLFILSNLNLILLADVVGYIVLALIILIALFLILREVNCWYWKINRRIDLMEEQNNLLKKVLQNYGGTVNPAKSNAGGVVICKKCSASNPSDSVFCESCGQKL